MESAHPVIQYIKEAKNSGLSNKVIFLSLTQVGWQPDDIIEILISHLDFEHGKFETAQNNTVISIENLSKSFGSIKALDNININVEHGMVLALLGPNGAGKTTLLKILATLTRPDSGSVQVANFDILKQPNQVRSVIGLTSQFTTVDEVLTGRENLELVGKLYHLNSLDVKQRAEELLYEFDLTEAADRSVRTYSGGMHRKLDLAASLVARPDILFLDEPTTGLDLISRVALWNMIKGLVSRGTTILLATQYLEEADHLADYIVVIDHGQIIAEGTADKLKNQTGGNILEVHLAEHSKIELAFRVMAALNLGLPYINREEGKLSLPISDNGALILIDTIRRMDQSGIKIADIVLHRPTLNDVFLALTGHIAK